jgi:HD superfamily phosphodiesterase
MKKITDIYAEYKIMPNLQMHQFRVAAVAFQICDSLDIKIDKESILKTCLLHDMGNIIKFNLSYFPEWNNPEGIEYWQKIKDDYITKYGNNEHHATIKITKDIGVDSYILELIDSVDPSLIEINRQDLNFDKKYVFMLTIELLHMELFQ